MRLFGIFIGGCAMKRKKYPDGTMWEVWHPEGFDHELRPETFGLRSEAIEKCRDWNKDIPGHVVRPVLPNKKSGE
jgi:hypothetical protein